MKRFKFSQNSDLFRDAVLREFESALMEKLAREFEGVKTAEELTSEKVILIDGTYASNGLQLGIGKLIHDVQDEEEQQKYPEPKGKDAIPTSKTEVSMITKNKLLGSPIEQVHDNIFHFMFFPNQSQDPQIKDKVADVAKIVLKKMGLAISTERKYSDSLRNAPRTAYENDNPEWRKFFADDTEKETALYVVSVNTRDLVDFVGLDTLYLILGRIADLTNVDANEGARALNELFGGRGRRF